MRLLPSVVLGVVAIGLAGCTTYNAELTGEKGAPPSHSVIGGRAQLDYNEHGGTFHQTLRVEGLKDITGATINMRPERSSGGCPCKEKVKTGPAVVQLAGSHDGVFAGTLSQGTFGPDAFIGPLAGHSISEFVEALREKRLYVQVATKEFPDGEIRGTLKP